MNTLTLLVRATILFALLFTGFYYEVSYTLNIGLAWIWLGLVADAASSLMFAGRIETDTRKATLAKMYENRVTNAPYKHVKRSCILAIAALLAAYGAFWTLGAFLLAHTISFAVTEAVKEKHESIQTDEDK